jgi:hypothetical protein
VRLDINNNLRPRPDVQSRDSDVFGMGVQDVTGTVMYYFKNLTVYNEFLSNTPNDLSFQVHDPDTPTKLYTFLMWKVKYTSVEVVTGGVETDIIANASFRALYDAPHASHLIINRVTT